ncbi:hypothetical protein CYMTET_16241 [Cymbomonas tetramitiformis]|uniref:Uncharacterized protein n=1 Tax=Cymbomonas tetramitiformis TaxID=36881 RepID=A0AAE0L846_9CHLO|nr:hypothetical protein CYMTET_16241 [Cymbomonas tetramitiformis]
MSDKVAPWEVMQMKTFTAFANAYIMGKDKKYRIENGELPQAFENGVRLIVLIEALMGGASLGKYHTKENLMKPLKIENINIGLKVVNDFNQSKGIKLVYGAEAVMNGNRTEVMGLVWILISKFLLEHISEEDSSAKEALLLWCKRKTEGYDGCKVVDFGTCWQNGMAFCALLHKHRPDLLDYSSLSPANAADNLELAFSIGEKELGIPRLLEVEDMTDMTVKPDEKSIMTYLMFVWKVFASYKQVEVAGRRIQKFIKTEKHNDALKKSYEASAKELMAWINEMIAYFHTADFGPNEDSVEGVYGKHGIFKNEDKPTKRNEMTDVQSSVSFIASKLLQEGRPPYELAEDMTTEFMEKLWKQMVDAEYVFEDLLQGTITQLTKQSATMNSIIAMLEQCRNWITDTNAILDKTVVEVLSVADAAHALAQHELYQEAWAQNQSKLDKLKRRQQLLADSGNCIHTSVPKGGEELAGALEASHSLESKLASRKAALTAELARQHSLDAQRLQWAKKAEDFVLWVEDIKEDLTMPIYIESGGEVDELIAALEVQVEGIRKSKTDDLQALVDLSQATMQDKVPNPYARFSIVDLEEKVKVVEQLIADRSAQLQAEKDLQKSNQELRDNYLKAAEAYVEWQTDLTQRIEKGAKDASGTLQEQLEQVDKLCEELQGGEPKKEAVLVANSALLENSVSAKSLAAVSTGDVETTFNLMRRMLSERRDLINEELIKENALAVSDEQLEELQELFKTFDKDGDEHLKSFEFKAVMQNMDIEVKEEDLQVFTRHKSCCL